MIRMFTGAAAAVLIALSFAPTGASARVLDTTLAAPGLIENAQFVVRERRVRPRGRVVVRERFVRPRGRFVDRCRVVRERIVRPNGRVVVRTVRRCF